MGEVYGHLSVNPRGISIGDDYLTIYEYDSGMAMETDAGFVGRGGSSIERPYSGEGADQVVTQITWASSPHWFKRDLLIVLYVGENEQIINFLAENLALFAG